MPTITAPTGGGNSEIPLFAAAAQPYASLFSDIAGYAAEAQAPAGAASDFLLRMGYSVEAIRNVLQTLSQVGAPQQQIAWATDEMRSLNNTGRPSTNTTGLWLLVGAGLLLWAVARDNRAR